MVGASAGALPHQVEKFFYTTTWNDFFCFHHYACKFETLLSGSNCPFPILPTLGQVCSLPGALDCHYGNVTDLSMNCCCSRCDVDMTCALDPGTGAGVWQKMYSPLCPSEGCGSQGEFKEKTQTAKADRLLALRCYCISKLPHAIPTLSSEHWYLKSGEWKNPEAEFHRLSSWMGTLLLWWLCSNHRWKWCNLAWEDLWRHCWFVCFRLFWVADHWDNNQ